MDKRELLNIGTAAGGSLTYTLIGSLPVRNIPNLMPSIALALRGRGHFSSAGRVLITGVDTLTQLGEIKLQGFSCAQTGQLPSKINRGNVAPGGYFSMLFDLHHA